jgi:hypothetical protein
MFFKKEPKDEQALSWSNRLFGAIKSSKKGDPKVRDIEKWTKVFMSLRKNHQSDEIESVLTWYCQHIGEEFVPVAITAMQFKFKFPAIVRAMSEDDSLIETIEQRSIDLAQSLLRDYKFPPEIAGKLALIIQRSRINWWRFISKVKTRTDRDAAFLLHVYELYSPVFVESWCCYLSQKYGFLQNYTGSISSLVFKPGSTAFRESFWRRWSDNWCANPNTFDDLLRESLK